ncbi:MAG: ParA family protein [Deltaproteobacteria bacterium]|nr:ParA family protein [Deltaproteobacteria bacterium]
MTRRIAFVNEKGGSCKTTLTVNVGAYFALTQRKKVLIVDMDPQGQVGKSLGIDVRTMDKSIYNVLANPDLDPSEMILSSRIPGLDLIISNKTLADFPLIIANSEDRHVRLKSKIDTIQGYDYILFDSPPSLGLITLNILLAVQEIVIPVSLTYFALDGCAEILDTVHQIRTNFHYDALEVSLVVPTLYRNTRMANAVLEKLKEHMGGKISKAILGYNVKIDEAQSHGLTIWEYSPGSSGAQTLAEVAEEIASVGAPREQALNKMERPTLLTAFS